MSLEEENEYLKTLLIACLPAVSKAWVSGSWFPVPKALAKAKNSHKLIASPIIPEDISSIDLHTLYFEIRNHVKVEENH